MKLFTGWVVSVGLVLATAAAQAQVRGPDETSRPSYTAVSDVGGPYAAMPPEAHVGRYGYGPTLLPAMEVYTVVRESGFSPLGIPRQRGSVYTIAVVDRSGANGRLVIDARDGRIVRFVPGGPIGDNFSDDVAVGYGAPGPLPPAPTVRGTPRPPRAIPHVASRTTVPVPKPSPLAAKPAPAPAQQSAAVAKPAEAPTVPPAAAAPPVVEAKPAAPSIQPTQDMPKAQGLE